MALAPAAIPGNARAAVIRLFKYCSVAATAPTYDAITARRRLFAGDNLFTDYALQPVGLDRHMRLSQGTPLPGFEIYRATRDQRSE